MTVPSYKCWSVKQSSVEIWDHYALVGPLAVSIDLWLDVSFMKPLGPLNLPRATAVPWASRLFLLCEAYCSARTRAFPGKISLARLCLWRLLLSGPLP